MLLHMSIDLHERVTAEFADPKLESLKRSVPYNWTSSDTELPESFYYLLIKADVTANGITKKLELTSDKPKEGYRLATYREFEFFASTFGYPNKPIKLCDRFIVCTLVEKEKFTEINVKEIAVNHDCDSVILNQYSLS